MNTSVRLALFSLIIFSPLTFAQYFEYDPDNPGEYAPLREGEKAIKPTLHL